MAAAVVRDHAIGLSEPRALLRSLKENPGARPGFCHCNQRGGRLQLPIFPQDFAAGTADAPALGGERRTALKQIAPRHAGRAVTQPRCGRLAGRKFGHVNGASAGAQSTENETRSKNHFHTGSSPLWSEEGPLLTHYERES